MATRLGRPVPGDAANRMCHALAVFILDARLFDWLAANDPQALRQAIQAVNDYNPSVLKDHERAKRYDTRGEQDETS